MSGMLAWRGRGRENHKFKAISESEASLDDTRQSLKPTIIFEVVSLNYLHKRTKGLVKNEERL